MIIFLGGSGLPIFLNVGTESPHRRRITIFRRLIRRVTRVLLKMIPIIDVLTLVTNFGYLGISVEDYLFLQAFNFGPVPLSFIQHGKE